MNYVSYSREGDLRNGKRGKILQRGDEVFSSQRDASFDRNARIFRTECTRACVRGERRLVRVLKMGYSRRVF